MITQEDISEKQSESLHKAMLASMDSLFQPVLMTQPIETLAREIVCAELLHRHGAGPWVDAETVKTSAGENDNGFTMRIAVECIKLGREQAAEIADNHEPQHEANTALSRAIAGNIAQAIRALT